MKKLICSLMVGLMSFSSAVSIVGAFDFACPETPIKRKSVGTAEDRMGDFDRNNLIELYYIERPKTPENQIWTDEDTLDLVYCNMNGDFRTAKDLYEARFASF